MCRWGGRRCTEGQQRVLSHVLHGLIRIRGRTTREGRGGIHYEYITERKKEEKNIRGDASASLLDTAAVSMRRAQPHKNIFYDLADVLIKKYETLKFFPRNA